MWIHCNALSYIPSEIRAYLTKSCTIDILIFVSVHYLDYVLRKLKKKEYVIEKRSEDNRKPKKNYVLSQRGSNFLVKVTEIFDQITKHMHKSVNKTEFEKLIESSLKLQQVCKDIIHSTKPKKTRINSNGLDTIN